MLGGSAFIFSARVGGAGLALVTQIILARWLGPEDLGVYLLAFSWCILLSTIASCGFPTSSIRFVGAGLANESHGYIRGFVNRAQWTIAMVSISFVVVGLVLLSFLDNMIPSMTRSALTVALLGVPFFALMGFHNGASNGFSRFAASFLPSNVIRPSLFLAVVLTAHWFGFEFAPDALVAVHVGVIVLISMGTFLALRKLLNSRFRQDNHEYETRLWIKTSSQLLLITLFVNNFAELCVILVGFFLPSDQVAIFHVGFRLALLISFALQSVDSFAAPQLSKLWAQKDDARFVAVVNRTARLQFWVTLLAVGCLALAGHRLLAIFGPEFVDGYRIMIILAGMQLVRAYVGPVSLLISISGCLLYTSPSPRDS